MIMARPRSKFKTSEQEPTPAQVTFSIRIPKENKVLLKKISRVYRKTPNALISEMLDWAIKDQAKELKGLLDD